MALDKWTILVLYFLVTWIVFFITLKIIRRWERSPDSNPSKPEFLVAFLTGISAIIMFLTGFKWMAFYTGILALVMFGRGMALYRKSRARAVEQPTIREIREEWMRKMAEKEQKHNKPRSEFQQDTEQKSNGDF
ncbi:DUF1467 family protein [Patescibacteria group bacterium AH-259-L07]|nr:DUF1467 family protein [Patescibacteria group bacterium AH-259-L07]